MTVQSVNGPAVTAIRGYQVPGTTNGSSAVRCAYLASGAALVGFTLANGATTAVDSEQYDGIAAGGVWCESTSAVVSNCVLAGNWAWHHGGAAVGGTLINCVLLTNTAGPGGWDGYYSSAGGAYGSILNNCALCGNVACDGGAADSCPLNNCLITGNSGIRIGGIWSCTATNCTIVGNSASGDLERWPAGGADNSTLCNCIVYYNSALMFPNYDPSSSLSFCCASPLPGGMGNITNAPLLLDATGGNFRLQTNSPCINAGNNSDVSRNTDLDGRPRIVAGTVDMGAYEFQGAGMGEFTGWLQQHGLRTDGSADYTDDDGDRMNNWQEGARGRTPRTRCPFCACLARPGPCGASPPLGKASQTACTSSNALPTSPRSLLSCRWPPISPVNPA